MTLKGQLRLTDADRERYGGPEWLDLDLDCVTIEEAEAIDEAGGDWTDVDTSTAKGTKTRIWLALYRANAKPPAFDEFSFNVIGLRGRSEGKDEGSADESSSTPPTSDSSTPD